MLIFGGAGSGKNQFARTKRPPGLKPACIRDDLRGPEGPLFHSVEGHLRVSAPLQACQRDSEIRPTAAAAACGLNRTTFSCLIKARIACALERARAPATRWAGCCGRDRSHCRRGPRPTAMPDARFPALQFALRRIPPGG